MHQTKKKREIDRYKENLNIKEKTTGPKLLLVIINGLIINFFGVYKDQQKIFSSPLT